LTTSRVTTIVSRMDDEARKRLWGRSVKDQRVALGMTQHELATAVGLRPGSISKIERGEMDCTNRMQYELAKALKTEVADLFPFPSVLQAAS
jgi:DNA-binding XRE family transcriptional regulator